MEMWDIFYNLPRLETERLIMSKISMHNASDMFEYASDPDVARYVSWDVHKSIRETKTYLKMIMKRYKRNEAADWGITYKSNGKFIGSCGFTNLNNQHAYAEIGYVLAKEYWDKGIMTEAVKAVIRFGFDQLRLNRIEAYHMLENKASERVMQKAGMVFEGIAREKFWANGVYNDAKLYSILRSERII